MTMRRQRLLLVAGALAVAAAAWPGEVRAQGAGYTAAEILRMPAGGRAAGLAGAYVATIHDPDAIFFNPAGLAGLQLAASGSYQRHVQGINLGSLAGAGRVGPVVLGVGITYLDGGSIDVIEPDDDFGGERGRETGERASARESATRLAAALELFEGRGSLGAALGYVGSELAGVSRSAPFVDLGAVFRVIDPLHVGVALRHLGGGLSGEGASAPLPAEVRLGAVYGWRGAGELGANASLDFIGLMEDDAQAVAAGLEAGLYPGDPDAIGAVLRLGFDSEGQQGLGGFRAGGGLSIGTLGLDYAYHRLGQFGGAHRVGVRWMPQPGPALR
jgi:hypothetical protein